MKGELKPATVKVVVHYGKYSGDDTTDTPMKLCNEHFENVKENVEDPDIESFQDYTVDDTVVSEDPPDCSACIINEQKGAKDDGGSGLVR